jgi:endoglucanase
MKILTSTLSVVLTLFLLSCNKSEDKIPATPPATPTPTSQFIKTDGSKIIDGQGKEIKLHGVAFGNEIWNNVIPQNHHSEIDYQRVKEMQMNAIRFYLSYKTFEDDTAPYKYKQSGWDWIDQNIKWAKANGIYLILNMHAPQGGYQSQGTGDALWNDIENQNRLTALWKEIATKYKNEPNVIGFGLVNEPVPTNSLSQWQELAQRITNEIRKVDKNHIVFIEKPIYIKNQLVEDANYNFPIISDSNLVYEYHFYDPHPYTHQLFSWANTGDGGSYPDNSIIAFSNSSWYTATFNNPQLSSGETDWTYFEGEKYTINDPKIKIAVPALTAPKVSGTVYFDDIVIKEYDAQGVFTKEIINLNLNNMDGWSYWSRDNSGTGSLSVTEGHNDSQSLSINGALDDSNFSNYTKAFVPLQNYKYQISGWMKGKNVATDASVKLRIDFLNTPNPIYNRNKVYLESIISKYVAWGKNKNVPLYVGEFGAGTHCFKDNKGGLQWVTDMVDILLENKVHFTYHAYHESSFGIYYGDGVLPTSSNSNGPLIELFKQKLKK